MIPGSRSPTVSRLSLLAATAAQRTSARPGSANNAARAPPPRVHFPCRPTATDARPYRQVRCRHRRPPSQAFAALRRPPTAAAKRHRSAHPALTARQGSADNALSRHLWPTGQSAVDDLCGRGHEAPPPAARQSLSERSNRTTRVEDARMTAGPADYDAQPEEGRCARVTLATAVAVAALQPAMLAEC